MSHDDRWDDTVRDVYYRPIGTEAEALERALVRLRREGGRPARSRGAWWLDPGALRVPPLVAAASLIAVLGVGLSAGVWWSTLHGASAGRHAPGMARGSAAAGDAAAQPTTVTFVFRAPGATRVCLVGDFNGWDANATPLRRAALGDMWTAQVPLPRGLHAYAFVIDGSDWSVDPSAPLSPEATFGRRNSVVVVGEGSAL